MVRVEHGNRLVLEGKCRGSNPMGSSSALGRNSSEDGEGRGGICEGGQDSKRAGKGKQNLGGREGGDGRESGGGEEGLLFSAALEVYVGADGDVKGGEGEGEGSQCLKVDFGSDGALILLTGASSFEGPFVLPKDTKKNPVSFCVETLDSVKSKNWDELLSRHLADFQPLMNKMDLQLNGPQESDKKTESGCSKRGKVKEKREVVLEGGNLCSFWKKANSHLLLDTSSTKKNKNSVNSLFAGTLESGQLSTDERLRRFKSTEDPMLVAILFQFGRYLLLSSSRPGSFVSNLQGIWSQGLNPPWRGCPHLNINLEMNYWPAEVCNLVDCHQPLFDLVKVIAQNGSQTAQENYGLPGWVCHHQSDIWGQTGTSGGDPSWALWPMGGAWLVLHLWENYCFSPDEEFLEKTVYPLLRGSALFFLNWLLEDATGHLVTCPSTSPEHFFLQKGGEVGSVAVGATMDISLLSDLFSACLDADEILGSRDVTFSSELRKARDKLLQPHVGKNGCLMEWAVDFDDPDPQHRHLSHLYGVYPGQSINTYGGDGTEEIVTAITNSIILRGEEGPGWSTAWKIALWSRLGNGDKAYSMICRLFQFMDPGIEYPPLSGGGLYPNLFNAHPPFQIDGNFGFSAAVAETMIQSVSNEAMHVTNIYLFPAFPWEKWPSGSATGLRARGGFVVDVVWGGLDLFAARIHCLNRQERVLFVSRGQEKTQISICFGQCCTLNARLEVVKND